MSFGITLARIMAAALFAALVAAGPASAQQAPGKAPDRVDMAEVLKPGPITENILGAATAPVTIVEYASLTCPHCATFHTRTLPMLKKDYIDTGKVRLIFRDFPFDVVAMAGTMVSRCAAPDQFFRITEALFENQDKWAFSKDPEQALRGIAGAFGFTQESFDVCLQKQDIYDGVLAVRKRGNETFGINSTPTLIVNGQLYRGALTPEQLEAVLAPLLAEKK